MTLALNQAGRARFAAWLQEVGKPGLKLNAIESDMLDVCTARAEAEESMSYELGSQYTTSGRPELFFANLTDFDPVFWELYESHGGMPYGVGTTKELAIVNAMEDAQIDSEKGWVSPSREWIMQSLASRNLDWRLVDKPATFWINLDADLRGTNVDPQALADGRGLLIVVDDDAAMTGPCWWGTAAPLDIDQALTDYRAAGGTVSMHWTPRRMADAPTT